MGDARGACLAARPAGDRRVARNGPISDGGIAASYDYANWRTYSASADARRQTPRGRAHGLGRARDARLGNRGCVALIRLTITPAAYAVIVATLSASVGLERAPNGKFSYGSSRNMSIGSAPCGSRVRATATSSCGWQRRAKEREGGCSP